MRETAPEVFLIARPQLSTQGVRQYLEAVGGLSWMEKRDAGGLMHGRPAENLVEFAGRACYKSWEPGLNPNVRKIREDQREYLGNLLDSGHGSVLEHAYFTFAFHNVSRVFTHELVRHRVGVAISQESLRYVRLTDIGFRVPPALERMRDRVVEVVESLEHFQFEAAAALGLDIDNEGDEWSGNNPKPEDILTFAEKKIITSAMRRLAPLGLSTELIWTANVRTIRHVLASRTAEGAEEEIRLVFDKVGLIMSDEAPSLFQDFLRQLGGAWECSNPVAGQSRPMQPLPEEIH